MKIERVKLDDIEEILELFCVSDPRHIRNKLYYKWRNLKSPFGQAHSFIMKLDNRIIAHYSVLPLDFRYNNRIIKVGFGQQAVVHPKFRNLKHIYNLMNAIYDYLMENSEIGFLIAFPNENFYLVKEKVLGWKRIFRSTAKVYKIDDILSKLSNVIIKGRIRKIDKLESLNLRSRGVANKNAISFGVNKDYIKWRYFDNPENFYIIFGYESVENTFDGVIFIKPYFDVNTNELIGHLLGLEAVEYPVELALIHSALKYLKEVLGISKVVQWDFGISPIVRFLSEYDYIEERYYVNFLGKNLTLDEDTYEDFLNVEKWCLDMHISDVY